MAQAAMLGATVLSTGLNVFGNIKEGEAAEKQGRYQQYVAEQNAKIAEEQATDAISLGEKDVNQVGAAVERTIGSQRVTYAAQGVDVNMGSAADVQRDTRQAGSQDVLTIRNNAARQAWGYRVQAQNYRQSGNMAMQAGQNVRQSSLVTAGLRGLDGVLKTSDQISRMGGGSSSESGGGGDAPMRAPTSIYRSGGKRLF